MVDAIYIDITELKDLVGSLATAVELDFMSRDHAKLIWRKYLKASGWDIAEPQSKKESNI